MRNLILSMVLMPALALSACGGDGDGGEVLSAVSGPAPVELGEEFALGNGDSIAVGDLTLKFNGVVTEERCPYGPNVTIFCAWEGHARISVSVTNGRTSDLLILSTHRDFDQQGFFAGHVVELRKLDPWPYDNVRRPAPEEYVATLFVDGWAVPGI